MKLLVVSIGAKDIMQKCADDVSGAIERNTDLAAMAEKEDKLAVLRDLKPEDTEQFEIQSGAMLLGATLGVALAATARSVSAVHANLNFAGGNKSKFTTLEALLFIYGQSKGLDVGTSIENAKLYAAMIEAIPLKKGKTDA